MTNLPHYPIFAQHDILNAPVLVRMQSLPFEQRTALPGDHLDDLCFLSMLSGTLHLDIQDEDVLIEEGDVILLQAKIPRTFRSEETCSYCVIYANPVLFQNSIALPLYILELFRPSSPSHFLLKKGHPDTEYISGLFDKILHLPKDSLISYRLTIMGYLHLILARFLFSLAQDPSFDTNRILSESNNLDNMLNYIHSHFHTKITLDDIAEAGNVSRSRCSPMFRKYMHTTPIEYVNNYRLEISRSYLLDHSISIASIANACGFSGQSYYTKLFVRKYGCTPSEYRLKNS